MSANSKIEWTRGDDGAAGATWNPVTGCVKVSEGCDHCYAATFAERWRGVPGHPFEQGFDLRLWPERLALPLTWRKAKRVFVNSMSDLFIGRDQVPDAFVAAVWATMFWTSSEARGGGWPGASLKPVHTYQILTKRPARMRSWLARWGDRDQRVAMLTEAAELGWADHDDLRQAPWMPAVLPNVWLGVSAENQRWADLRIPALLDTPAAVRFVSAEPLLGPIDLTAAVRTLGSQRGHGATASWVHTGDCCRRFHGLDWVIVGGESGPRARPMHPLWARGLRDQCTATGVAFFFKQWGEWGPATHRVPVDQDLIERWSADRDNPALVAELKAAKAASEAVGATHGYAVWAHQYGWEPHEYSHRPWSVERTSVDESMHASIRRWGKKAAGRQMDGRTWDQMPTAAAG